MIEENVITIGITALNHDTSTFNISKFYTTTDEDGVVSINLSKEENENRIVEEINTLMLQEEKQLTGDNISRIEELIKKLPIEAKRIELVYRKNTIFKLIKAQKLIQELKNNINGKNHIEKIEDIFLLMNKYEEISKIKRNFSLEEIEDSLINIHKDKFEELFKKGNYILQSVEDNIEKYEEIKNYIDKLQKNIKFISNTILKDAIMDEINALNSKKISIGTKLTDLLNCDESSLEQVIKVQKLINTINHSDSQEQIDNELIENNFVDYINLGQMRRKEALEMFIEKKHNSYTTIEEVNKDLDVIVSELKNQSYATDTIEFQV